MKIGKTLKTLSAIMLAFAMLLGVCGISGNEITANASENPVKMYFCDDVINWRGYVEYNVYIQVDAGSAANKAVSVHYKVSDDVWADVSAEFVTKLDSNTEIWKAKVSGYIVDREFAIKYVGDGQTYWDNNNGNNYTNYDILGAANVKVERLSYHEPRAFKVQAVVKNLAFAKKVKVRYTLDNWASYQEADLSFDSSIPETDTERWNVTLNLDEDKMDSFQYCVSYEVNGQTYWDNNFGNNYNRSYYKPLN